MHTLDGRVCVVTGAGRGLGRAHALALAAEGARLVVNDPGAGLDGRGIDGGPAAEVVDEIRQQGGTAIANTDSVASWDGSRRIIESALDAFGQLDVLVNNAGILRDRSFVNMTETEWDEVIAVHLKGHFLASRWAAAHWRDQAKSTANPVRGSIINTASTAMFGNPGQANYSAAKAGIAAMTLTMAMELDRYGIRVNAIAPAARTRMTTLTSGMADLVAAPSDPAAFDPFDPGNVSPLVVCLAMADCAVTGGVFHVGANEVGLLAGWTLQDTDLLLGEGRWAVTDLADALRQLADRHGPIASVGATATGLLNEFGHKVPHSLLRH
jgi:NAD(P)-dependent dehydrogenase (short-subunit alcohol dehydrogenase family)